jgi:DNA-binding beta-propeller fold protein YncE
MEFSHATIIAGGGSGGDGIPASDAALIEPFAIEFDGKGNMFIAEMMGHRIRVVDQRGIISTLAGNGTAGPTGDNGPAINATLNGLHDIRISPADGHLYVADTWNARIRKIDRITGIITTVAGTGEKGFSGDEGRATDAQIGDAYAIAFDRTGRHLYLADLDNQRVRMIDLELGTITTVAGNGQKGPPDDGSIAVEAPLKDPRAVAVDKRGTLYILERGGHCIRQVTTDGRISRIVGTGEAGYSGDEGPARDAQLRGPKHLVVDRDGNLIIADTENHVIRRYLANEGRIVHVAGTGAEGAAIGSIDQVQFNRPHGVCVHPDGSIYAADSYNNRVIRLS